MTSERKDSTMDDPLVTQAAVEKALGRLREAFRARMQHGADNLVRVASATTDEMLMAAYLDGVRDGFVQGAEAQARTALEVTDDQ